MFALELCVCMRIYIMNLKYEVNFHSIKLKCILWKTFCGTPSKGVFISRKAVVRRNSKFHENRDLFDNINLCKIV